MFSRPCWSTWTPSILTQTFFKTKTFNVNVSASFIVVFEVRRRILVFVFATFLILIVISDEKFDDIG